MSDETTNVSQDTEDTESLFDIDQALLDELGLDANEGEVEEGSDEQASEVEKPKEPAPQESGKWSLADVAGKSWEELSANEDKIPAEAQGLYKSMTRAVQMKMQTLAEERKEAKKIREEVEDLKRQLREEPPYIREERERRKQEEKNRKLEELSPEERMQYEFNERFQDVVKQLEETRKELEYEKFSAFKQSFMSDIRDELISEGLPVKSAKDVYDLWSRNALHNTEYSVQDAVRDFKEIKPPAKEMTKEELDAIVKQRLKEEIEKLKARSNKANGVRSTSTKVPATPNSGDKKFNSAEDIFSDISQLLGDT